MVLLLSCPAKGRERSQQVVASNKLSHLGIGEVDDADILCRDLGSLSHIGRVALGSGGLAVARRAVVLPAAGANRMNAVEVRGLTNRIQRTA